MQARFTYSAALATLLALPALLAPALSQAHDELNGPAPLSSGATPNTPRLSASDLASQKIVKPASKAAEDDAFHEKDVWGRIRSGYAIPDISNELVGKHVNW